MRWPGLFIAVSLFVACAQTAASAAERSGDATSIRSLAGVEQLAKGKGYGKHKNPKLKHYRAHAYYDHRAVDWHHGGPPPWAPAHGYRRKHGHGYQNYAVPYGIGLGRCNRGALGALLGGAAGGVIASEAVSGDGRTVAIIGGTILGAVVGGSIGRSMDEVDQTCVGQALEHAPDGEEIVWNSPEDGSRYQVTPTGSYQDQAGQYCREYQTTAEIAGQHQQTYGVACRQPDGSWRLVQ
jgi:surface antigen